MSVEPANPGRNRSTGVLLTNLGTPDAPTTPAVRRYLAEFLWDPRVIELSRPLWWLILHCIVLRVRPRLSAAAYRTVWTEEGSPLLVGLKKQAQALAALASLDVEVAIGVRYGNPPIIGSSALSGQSQGSQQPRWKVLPAPSAYGTISLSGTRDA